MMNASFAQPDAAHIAPILTLPVPAGTGGGFAYGPVSRCCERHQAVPVGRLLLH